MWKGCVGVMAEVGPYYVEDVVVVVEAEGRFSFRVDVVHGFWREVVNAEVGVEGPGESSGCAGDAASYVGEASGIHGYEWL